MNSEELIKEELPLAAEEKKLLRKRAAGTIIAAAVIVAVTGFIFYRFSISGMLIPGIIFLVFFLGILSFIIIVRLQNARANTKVVYTGKVHEKRTEIVKGRDLDTANEEYTVLVADKWFTVEDEFYHKLHAGDMVRLHTVRHDRVFKVEQLRIHNEHVQQQHSARAHQTSFYHSEASFESLNDQDRRLIRRALLKSFFFRTILGGIGSYILFYIVFAALAILTSFHFKTLGLIYWLNLLAISIFFIVLNLRTVRLFLDLQSGIKLYSLEKLIDKVSSNVIKPGPSSVLTTRRYINNQCAFFYFQTEKRWVSVPEDAFRKYNSNDTVPITLSKHTKLFLSIS